MSAVGKSSQLYSGFDPRTLGDCALWLDAADTRTLTLSGSNVTAWADKSGSNANFGAVAGSYPITSNAFGGKPSVYFSASSLMTSASQISFATSQSWFLVFSGVAGNNTYFFIEQSSNANSNSGMFFYGQNGALYFQNRAGTFKNYYDTAAGLNVSPFSAGVGTIAAFVDSNLTGTFTSNGTVRTLSNSGTASTLANNQSDFVYINRRVAATSHFGELIVFNAALTTAQRQQVEGYLAWKWGISSSFQPTSISGLSLWLDGADRSSMTLVGSNVSQWNDKSGNARHATALGTGPTYTSNVFNGYSAPVFSNSPLRTPSHILSPTNSISAFMVYRQTGLTTGAGGNSELITTANAYWYFTLFNITSSSNTALTINSMSAVYSITSSNSFNSNYILGATSDGSTARGFVNGSQTLSTSIGTIVYSLNSSNSWDIGQSRFVGPICEVILYNSNVSTDQRQQVEDYLSRKWNVSLSRTILNLPSSHPFRLAPPVLRPFNPNDIANCALWLDAADAKTITLSGSNVTAWADKSGLGYSAAAVNWSGTITRTTQNGISALNFGANTMRISNYSWTTYSSLFMLVKAAGGNWFFCQSRNNNEYTSFFSGGNWNLYQAFNGTSKIGLEDSGFPQGTVVLPANQYVLITFAYGGGTSAAFYTINGTSRTTRLASGAAIGTSSAQVFQLDINGRWDGASDSSVVCEIIQYNGVLSTTQRQQVESYLATKWGLQGSTPSTHPARIAPALTVQFQPTLLSNCALWLDAADAKTMTLSGSNVTAWTDKSGSNVVVSNTSNYPVYASNQIGGRPGVQFSGSNQLQGSYTYATQSTLFVVYTTTKVTGYSRLVDINSNGYGNFGAPWNDPPSSINADALLWLGGSNYPAQALYTTLTPQTGSRVYSVVYNGTSSLIWRNGSAQTLAGSGFSTTANGTLIGIGGLIGTPSTDGFVGSLGEVILFKSNLSTTDRQQVEGYLATKWGLQGSLPASHPYKNTPLL